MYMKIRHLLFDLDNTLYPSTAAIDQGITSRMIGFVADVLELDFQQAAERRQQRLPFYGTTLEWLKTEHGLEDTDAYFAAVHPPQELQELNPDPNLRPLLQSLGLPMTILTNAPRCHAQRVLEFLNVVDLFTGIHDIQSNGFKGKPYPDSYRTALAAGGFTVAETLFFDDHKKYTDGYQAIGGQAVLVQHPATATGHPHPLDSIVEQADSPKTGPAQLVIASVYQVPQVLELLAKK